jgi:hypothetical protein
VAFFLIMIKLTSRTRWIIAAVAGVVLVLLAASALRRPAPEPEAEIITAREADEDTLVARRDAIGLCAINRQTGVLEGQIVEVVERGGAAESRYRVGPLGGGGPTVDVRADAVHLDLCERAATLQRDGTPVRVEPRPR